jgi:hypothetical protein
MDSSIMIGRTALSVFLSFFQFTRGTAIFTSKMVNAELSDKKYMAMTSTEDGACE